MADVSPMKISTSILSDDSFLFQEISVLKAKDDDDEKKKIKKTATLMGNKLVTEREVIILSSTDDEEEEDIVFKRFNDDKQKAIPTSNIFDDIQLLESPNDLNCSIVIDGFEDNYDDVLNQGIQSSTPDNLDEGVTFEFTILKSSQKSSDGEWVEDLADNEVMRFNDQQTQSTPSKLIRPGKIAASFSAKGFASGRKNRLKAAKPLKPKKNAQPKEKEDLEEENLTPAAFQPRNALCQIKVEITSDVIDYAREKIASLLSERAVEFRTIESESNFPCVTWLASSALREALAKLDADNFCIRVNNQSKFEQLLIVADSELIYDAVCTFLDRSEPPTGSGINESGQSDLFDFVETCCRHYSIYNVTLVCYGLEKFYRSQRNRQNNSFRRRINEMLVEETGAKARKKKTKEATREISSEQVEMCLIDTKIRFFLAHQRGADEGDRAGRFTTIRLETGQELAESIFRYTRSLSEQIFRYGRVRSSVDFYAQTSGPSAIDPTINSDTQRMLWLRQLRQFPNLSSIHSEAIAERFDTPLKLWQELRASSEPIKMLASISTRGRVVGMEAATKIYLYMTTLKPETMLKLNQA